MITAFTLRNFKSYREATLPIGPLTLLIGANASGKSNAIEGVQFLSTLASYRLDKVFELLTREKVLRGGMYDLRHLDEETFGLGCHLRRSTKPPLQLHVTIRPQAADLVIAQEHLRTRDGQGRWRTLYETTAPPADQTGLDVRCIYPLLEPEEVAPSLGRCDDPRKAVFTQLENARFSHYNTEIMEFILAYAGEFQRALENIAFFNPLPHTMRDYVPKLERDLHRDGDNLSGVLYTLCQDASHKQRILDFVQSLPEQHIRALEFIETPRGDVLLQLVETFSGQDRRCDAPKLSDGTLHVLAVAAAMLSVPAGSVVIIEEIDNGIHPSRADLLMRNIRQIANERSLRVLLTTHNPALMAALPLEAIPDVVYCYRDPTAGDSRLARLSDLEDYPRLIARGNVGQLTSRGILEQRFKQPPPPPDEQIAQALARFEAFKAEVHGQ